MDYACLDLSRAERCGRPEVVFCPGKEPGQVAEIAKELREKNGCCLCTRAGEEHWRAVGAVLEDAEFHALGRLITVGRAPVSAAGFRVGVVSAGTADQFVAEEAACTLEFYGWEVARVRDVGVAGLHRLMERLEILRSCSVLIVVAGMEGALASVVGGMVKIPVIAVPTSVGYGANFSGLAPLLSMLNSCSAGVTVVNIDNGFGAASAADSILRLAEREKLNHRGGELKKEN